MTAVRDELRRMQKLGLSHRSELVRLALQPGLLKPV